MMTSMPQEQMPDDPIPYLDRLRHELVSAHPVARRARVRRQRLTAFGAVVMALAVAFVAMVSFQSTPASAAVIVTHEGQMVVVRMTTERARFSEVVDALRAAKVNAQVVPLATGPSGVGRFLRYNSTQPEDQAGALQNPAGSGFKEVRFPAASAGAAVLSIGREANPGEQYVVNTDAFQAGEPLGCLALQGAPVEALVKVLSERQLAATWLDATGRISAVPAPGTYVASAHATSATELLVRLTATPAPAPLPPDCS